MTPKSRRKVVPTARQWLRRAQKERRPGQQLQPGFYCCQAAMTVRPCPTGHPGVPVATALDILRAHGLEELAPLFGLGVRDVVGGDNLLAG